MGVFDARTCCTHSAIEYVTAPGAWLHRVRQPRHRNTSAVAVSASKVQFERVSPMGGGMNKRRCSCSPDQPQRYRSTTAAAAIQRFQGSEGIAIFYHALAEFDAQPSPLLRQKRATITCRERAAIILAGKC